MDARTLRQESTARLCLEAHAWPQGPRCPVCSLTSTVTKRKRSGFFRCKRCVEDFTVRTGTVLERSHVPISSWVRAASALLTTSGGVHSLRLAADLLITQKTAISMLRKLREACAVPLAGLEIPVEPEARASMLEAMIGAILNYDPQPKSVASAARAIRRRKHEKIKA